MSTDAAVRSGLSTPMTFAMAAASLLSITIIPVLMYYFITPRVLPKRWGWKWNLLLTLSALLLPAAGLWLVADLVDGLRPWQGWLAAGWAVLYAGTVVTGSGPHAGDIDSPRNGLDPRGMSQLHADTVFLLLGLTIGLLLALHATGARQQARRAAAVLLVVELSQGLVGFVQYFTGLPVAVVAVHLLGSALVVAAMTWALVETRAPTRHGQDDAPATRG